MYGRWEVTIGEAAPFYKGKYAEIKNSGGKWKISVYNKKEDKDPVKTEDLSEVYYKADRCHIFQGKFKDSTIALTVVVADRFTKSKQVMVGVQVDTGRSLGPDIGPRKEGIRQMEGTWGAEEMG